MTSEEAAKDAAHALAQVPVQGQGLALDLVATDYIRGGRRGRRVDALASPAHLDVWLAAHEVPGGPPASGATHGDLRQMHQLRSALQGILAARFGRSLSRAVDVSRAFLNHSANAVHVTHELNADLATTHTAVHSPSPIACVMAEIARDALRVLSDTHGYLHACPAPACILYFWDETGRKRWCSASCGTRVRVARHAAAQAHPASHVRRTAT